MSDQSIALRTLESSHFLQIAQALVSGADHIQLSALKNLIFWRERELKQELVRYYAPGDEIVYFLEDSKTEKVGRIHHLNKLSVSIHDEAGRYKAIPIERVLRHHVEPSHPYPLPKRADSSSQIEPERPLYLGEDNDPPAWPPLSP